MFPLPSRIFYPSRGTSPRLSRCNFRNCVLSLCLRLRIPTARVNRPLLRLDGKLNYKDPDWLDPPEARSLKEAGLFRPTSSRNNNFWNCMYIALFPFVSPDMTPISETCNYRKLTFSIIYKSETYIINIRSNSCF